jgi:hypothetical protein
MIREIRPMSEPPIEQTDDEHEHEHDVNNLPATTIQQPEWARQLGRRH